MPERRTAIPQHSPEVQILPQLQQSLMKLQSHFVLMIRGATCKTLVLGQTAFLKSCLIRQQVLRVPEFQLQQKHFPQHKQSSQRSRHQALETR